MGFGLRNVIKKAKDQKEYEGPKKEIAEMDLIHQRDFE